MSKPKKPPHLTQAETNRLLCYVAEVKDLLLLRDSQVLLMHQAADDNEDASDGVWACINWSDTKRIGLLQVCTQWEKLSPAVKSECIVHELLHLQLRDVDDQVNMLQGRADLGIQQASMWRMQYDRAMELTVHQLTRLLLHTVPEWPGNVQYPPSSVFTQREDDGENVG